MAYYGTLSLTMNVFDRNLDALPLVTGAWARRWTPNPELEDWTRRLLSDLSSPTRPVVYAGVQLLELRPAALPVAFPIEVKLSFAAAGPHDFVVDKGPAEGQIVDEDGQRESLATFATKASTVCRAA